MTGWCQILLVSDSNVTKAQHKGNHNCIIGELKQPQFIAILVKRNWVHCSVSWNIKSYKKLEMICRILGQGWDKIADLSYIYGRGLISTSFFMLLHTGRCDTTPVVKGVALSRPGWWALDSCSCASSKVGLKSHRDWEEHTNHLFYIKSVRTNTELNNLQGLKMPTLQHWI